MKQKFVTGIYIVLILLVGIASVFILHHAVQPMNVTPQSPLDSYVNGATLHEYNESGQLKSKIIADKIEHFESHSHSTTLFIKPLMVIYSNDRTPWYIHADQATMDKASETVLMQGNVVIHELATSQHSETKITTSSLTLYPKESLAETGDAVIMSRHGTVIHGKGFVANLKTNTYQLQSESDAIYKPTPKNTDGH